MEKVNEIFDLNIYRLEILASSPDELKEIRDKKLKRQLKTCLIEQNCDDLKKTTNHLGEE